MKEYIKLEDFKILVELIDSIKLLRTMKMELHKQLTQKAHEKLSHFPSFLLLYPPMAEYIEDKVAKSVEKKNPIIIQKLKILQARENELNKHFEESVQR